LEVEAKEVEGTDKAKAKELRSKADDQKKNALNIRRLEEADLEDEANEAR
jgi:hypothetical protein